VTFLFVLKLSSDFLQNNATALWWPSWSEGGTTILEEDHPMTILSKFGSRQEDFYVNFP
jgi:hypothetical protein